MEIAINIFYVNILDYSMIKKTLLVETRLVSLLSPASNSKRASSSTINNNGALVFHHRTTLCTALLCLEAM